MILSRDRKITREELLESLAEQDTQIIALAYAHAQYLKMYGVDIEKALYTATENAEVMTRAYQRGYYDTMKRSNQFEDTISRQAVLDTLDNHKYSNEFCEEHHIDWSINLGMAHIAINDLPPVNPQAKTGHWIEHEIDDVCRWLECSNCHYETYNVKHNYCMNCGSKMVEQQKSEEA